MNEIFETLNSLSTSHHCFALCTIVDSKGSTPRKAGSKMIVQEDGSIIGTIGGGNLEHTIQAQALEALQDKKTRLIEFDLKNDLQMECGGSAVVFIEPFTPQLKLLIFGAGHIGQQLSPLARKLGFSVTVIDDRKEMLHPDNFHHDVTLIHQNPADAASEFDFDNNTFVVILTHKHVHDFDILKNVIDKPLAYVGMIGSSKKVAQALGKLQTMGYSKDLFDKLYAPIGFAIKADTPEEIAVLIAAELVKIKKENERRKGE